MSSSLEQAFLQDILANPEDDAPRLIYADWLEEHREDDPASRDRAEFIRLQCELEHLEEDDGRSWLLRSRAAELLAAHEKAWLEPVRVLGHRWEFRRGFIEKGRLATGQFHSHAERLFAHIPLQHLELWRPADSQAFARDYEAVSKLPCLARLRGLALLRGLDGEDFKAMVTTPHLGGLRELAVTIRSLSPPALAELAAMPAAEQLRGLHVTVHSTDGSLEPLLESSRLGSIEALRIWGHEMTPQELALLPSALPHLRELDLMRHQILAREPATHAAFRRLHRVKISNPDLSGGGLPTLIDLFEGGELRHLSLYCNPAYCKDTDEWPRIPPLPFLKQLELCRTGISTNGIRHLARSALLNGLTLLNLQGNNSGNEGTRALAESLHLRELRVLNLRFNGVGDEGVRALADSPLMGNLACLDLAANRVTDLGAEELATSRHLKHLVYRRLPRNDISSRAQEMLRERFGTGVSF